MIYLSLILPFLLGYCCIKFFSRQLPFIQHLGFSFPLGIGMQTVFMFILEVLDVKINLPALIITSILITGIFSFLLYRKRENFISFLPEDKLKVNIPWLFYFGIVAYLLYGIISKGLFWPIAEYDSLTGFELMGKMIAKEGTFRTVIFDYPSNSTYDLARFIYPPLTSGFIAYGYMAGANPKIVTIILYLSFIIAFYGILKDNLKDTWAIFITFFMMITPEMFSHVSLGLTNLPNAVYTSLAFLCLLVWFESKNISYILLSYAFLFFSIWSRSDSIVFLGGAFLIFAINYLKTREWKLPVIYLILGILPFVIWNFYIKMNVEADSSQFFIKSLFWDYDKLSAIMSKAFSLMLGDTLLYGFTFYLFVLLLAVNIVDVALLKSPVALLVVITWFFYTMLYYQIDYSFAGSIDAYLNASYKRGLFNFIPLIWFFIATSPLSQKAIKAMDKWLYS